MRPNRAGPARGFSWQTSPQIRNRDTRARFASEPVREWRKTSGKCGTAEEGGEPSRGCRSSGSTPHGGGCPPRAPGESRRRGGHAARQVRASAAGNACPSAEGRLPRASPCRTTISLMPLDHPRWAGAGTPGWRVVTSPSNRQAALWRRSTCSAGHPSPSTLPRLSSRPSDAPANPCKRQVFAIIRGLRRHRRLATMPSSPWITVMQIDGRSRVPGAIAPARDPPPCTRDIRRHAPPSLWKTCRSTVRTSSGGAGHPPSRGALHASPASLL
jgi:hypothetical protein